MKKLTFLLCALVCSGVLGAQTYYITGNSATLFGASWDPAKMALDAQSDGTYAKTFTTCEIGTEYQFKVTDGTWNNTWGFSNLTSAPEGVTGNSDNNIVCTTYDANMTVVFDPAKGKITLTGTFTNGSGADPGTTTYYMKHSWNGGDWTWKELADNGDGTYSIRDIYGGSGCNWNTQAKDDNSQWISNPTLLDSPAKGDSAVFTLDPTAETITITKIVSTAPAVALTVTGDTKLDSEVTLSAAVSNIEGDVTYNYYVKVDEGEFTALEGTNYTFDALGTYTFKVEAKVGDVVKATDTKTVTIAYDWYVRGSFTTNWAVDIKYGMPKNTEGVYSLSFELEAGTYAFKLSKVDTWVGAIGADAVNADCSDQGWEGDDNIKFTLGTAATVTVTYDGTKICLTSTLGKFGKVVITSYTIVGDAAIVGADWNTTNTAADMTDNGDGTWTWEKKDCDLEVTDYTYKVVGNHDYAVYQYPASDANKVLPITEIGTYDIVYTFKPGETPELTAVATKHSSPVTGLQESVVPVIYTRDGRIYGADDMRIYTVLGLDVTNMNGQLNGIYVVKTQAGIVKVVVR